MIPEAQRRRTAYHEAGHALLGMLQPGADPVRKVSIIPRGRALGVTLSTPESDRYGYDANYLRGRIIGALGGMAAEQEVFDVVTTGAESDLETVTRIARSMVGRWGMSERIGTLSVLPAEGDPRMAGVSDGLLDAVDEEVRRITDECYAEARRLLRENRDKLDAIVAQLLAHESLDEPEIYAAAGIARPAVTRTTGACAGIRIQHPARITMLRPWTVQTDRPNGACSPGSSDVVRAGHERIDLDVPVALRIDGYLEVQRLPEHVHHDVQIGIATESGDGARQRSPLWIVEAGTAQLRAVPRDVHRAALVDLSGVETQTSERRMRLPERDHSLNEPKTSWLDSALVQSSQLIHYDDKQLQVRVRDDGKGIDRAALQERRPGHFGLPGMRERAEVIGGQLDVWSEAGLGTEVDLKVPAAAAYATPRAHGRLWLLFARVKTGW